MIRAKNYWLEQFAAGKQPSLRIAQLELGISMTTAARARDLLVQEGKLPQPVRSFRFHGAQRSIESEKREVRMIQPLIQVAPPQPDIPPDPKPEPPPKFTKNPEVEAILTEPYTPEEQRMELTLLASRATREETKVAALSALRQLDLAQGVKQEGGPGRPLTDEEFEERIEAIFAAIPEQFLYKFQRKGSNEATY